MEDMDMYYITNKGELIVCPVSILKNKEAYWRKVAEWKKNRGICQQEADKLLALHTLSKLNKVWRTKEGE